MIIPNDYVTQDLLFRWQIEQLALEARFSAENKKSTQTLTNFIHLHFSPACWMCLIAFLVFCIPAIGQDFSHIKQNGVEMLQPNLPMTTAVVQGSGAGLKLGPVTPATNGNNQNSVCMFLVGSVFVSAATDDSWQICVKENSQASTIGSDLQIDHSSLIGNGAGRVHVDSDFLIGPPGSATSGGNFNSFAGDLEGSYWDGSTSQFNLWEFAVNTTPATGGTINSRFTFLPLFTGTCSGCTADFAIGGAGTLSQQGNYAGAPLWDFPVLPTDGFTATFTHTLTANRIYPWPDVGGTVLNSAYATLSVPITSVAGSAGAPSFKSPTDATTGPYFAANGDFRISAGGNDHLRVEAGDLTISSADCYRWGSSGVTGADTTFGRVSAALIEMGCFDVAGPSTYTIQGNGARAGTDSNTAGKGIILQPGTTTGNAVPPQMTINGLALGNGSGSTAQSYVSRLVLNATKVLSNNSTTTVANVTDASDTTASVMVTYSVEVNDGGSHHQQNEIGSVICSVANSNGTITVGGTNGCTKYGNQQIISASGGTLAVTWTLTGANPALLQVNSNTGTITPLTIRVTYELHNLTQQAVAIQ